MKTHHLVAFALALTLGACDTDGTTTSPLTVSPALVATCQTYSLTLQTLTVLIDADRLTLDQAHEVQRLSKPLTAVCTSENPPTVLTGAALAAYAALTSIAEGSSHE